jgi:hypothetical protein
VLSVLARPVYRIALFYGSTIKPTTKTGSIHVTRGPAYMCQKVLFPTDTSTGVQKAPHMRFRGHSRAALEMKCEADRAVRLHCASALNIHCTVDTFKRRQQWPHKWLQETHESDGNRCLWVGQLGSSLLDCTFNRWIANSTVAVICERMSMEHWMEWYW